MPLFNDVMKNMIVTKWKLSNYKILKEKFNINSSNI